MNFNNLTNNKRMNFWNKTCKINSIIHHYKKELFFDNLQQSFTFNQPKRESVKTTIRRHVASNHPANILPSRNVAHKTHTHTT